MITRLHLRNFAAFSDLEIDFSPKINVIIGENGTGKTQLMKAAYALSAGAATREDQLPLGKKALAAGITSKLLRLFMPLDDHLGRLHHIGATGNASMQAQFSLGQEIVGAFGARSKSLVIKNYTSSNQAYGAPVFIPTKEVLAWIKTISSPGSDKETVRNLFDDTYLDLCSALMVDVSDQERRFDLENPRFGDVFPRMVNAIGGKFEFVEGRFRFRAGRYQERRATHQYKYGDKVETVFHPIKGSDLSNNMTAEGFRKIGILQQLLTNQSLNPDVSGSLFWDEPESNLNPRLIRLLVEILLELSRNGQQIILATHDYVLLKWFDLLVDLGKADHVRYHSLYRENATVPLRINSTNEYLAIAPNSIDDTFAALINTELDRAMEGLGK